MGTTQNNAFLTTLQLADGDAVGAANPLPVDIVSPDPLPVTTTPSGTGVVTRVATNVANVLLKAANVARKGLTVYNSSTANLFVKLGAVADIGAGTESYSVRVVPNGYYEVPFEYTGIVDGIWDGADATGEALITELTA